MKVSTNKIIKFNYKIKKKGFTLMELLISLAIIASLSMIMAPMVIGKVQESKEKADVANANSIAMAVKTEMLEKKTGTITVDPALIKSIGEKYFDGKLPVPQSVEDVDFDIVISGHNISVSANNKIFYPYTKPIT